MERRRRSRKRDMVDCERKSHDLHQQFLLFYYFLAGFCVTFVVVVVLIWISFHLFWNFICLLLSLSLFISLFLVLSWWNDLTVSGLFCIFYWDWRKVEYVCLLFIWCFDFNTLLGLNWMLLFVVFCARQCRPSLNVKVSPSNDLFGNYLGLLCRGKCLSSGNFECFCIFLCVLKIDSTKNAINNRENWSRELL